MRTVVSTRKQVSIPASICNHLGIKPGWELDWHALPDGTLKATPVPPARELSQRIRERARGWQIPAGTQRASVEQERERERENEAREGRPK